MHPIFYMPLASAVVAAVVLHTDLRRRRLSLTRAAGWRLLSVLDLGSSAVCSAVAAGLAVRLMLAAISVDRIELPWVAWWGIISNVVIFVFLWAEGHRQIQFQRPRGILFAEWLILAGFNQALASTLFGQFLILRRGPAAYIVSGLAMAAGAIVIAAVVPPFMKKGSEYHRILEHLVEEGEWIQQEYAAPTPECPNPKLWKMVDPQTTELEVLDFLKCMVTTLKPSLIVETGTFLGYGTIKLAEGARANGFGKVITIESDPMIYAKARERIEAAGLSNWVECRNESSLDTRIEGTIDFYFSDSALAIREKEIRRLLPLVGANGIIAIHDASSQFAVVREAALRMEREGLLSVVLLSTPRGLVLAQKARGQKISTAGNR